MDERNTKSSRPVRLLILGGTGMLGHKLWQDLSKRFPETFATVRSSRSAYAKYNLFENGHIIDGIDVSNFALVEKVLKDIRPQFVLNGIGITKRHEEADSAVPALTLNALLPHRLAEWAERNDAKIVNFGTDCAFDGRLGNYADDALTNAEDLYGRTKALGEIRGKNSLTLRSSFIGRELRGRTELLEWFLQQKGKRIRGFRKALYSGLSTPHLAEVVGDIIEKFPHLNGLYNVSSEPISKYDLLLLAKDAFKLDVELEPDDTVVCKRNLNSNRFRQATGWRPPTWASMMKDLAEDPTPYDRWK